MNNGAPSQRVVILGAGLAGLAAAWKLSSRGVPVTVIEKATQVGGLSRTVRRGPFSFDIGGHRFLTLDKALEKEILDLMEGELALNARVSTILMDGQFIKYPLDLLDLTRKMSLPFMLKAFGSYLLINCQRLLLKPEDRSFEEWVKRRFGSVLYNIYFGVYTEKLWGVSPTQISADWASQRISLIHLWDVLYRLVWKKTHQPKTYATEFYYPDRGIGEIAEKMAALTKQHHGTILLEAEVTGVVFREGGEVVVEYDHRGNPQELPADFLICSIPLPDLIQRMNPKAPSDLQSQSRSLRFRSVRLLNICLDMPRVTDNTWIYVPEKEYLFFRIQEPRNWSSKLCPEGKTSLTLEIACDEGDEIWRMPDEELLDRCLRDLARVGLSIEPAKVLDFFSLLEKHAYPVYRLDYREILRTVYAYLDKFPRLILCGRQGLFRYNNMDHSIRMGFLAAESILGRKPKSAIFEVADAPGAFEYKA